MTVVSTAMTRKVTRAYVVRVREDTRVERESRERSERGLE